MLWLLWCFESCTRAAVAGAAIIHCCEVCKMREQHHAQMNMKSWTVARVITWLFCEHGVETSKDWLCRTFHESIKHNDDDAVHRRTLRIPDVTLYTCGLVWAASLSISGRGSTMNSKCMSRMQACLKYVQPPYNTFKALVLWKTSQGWVSSAARQKRPSMVSILQKIMLVNIWILN